MVKLRGVFTRQPSKNVPKSARTEIREADASDQPRLAELDAQSERGVAGAGLGALPRADAGDSAEEDDEPAVVLVAGRPAVAYIRLDRLDGNAHVDRLAVLPVVAKRGLGQDLLNAAIAWARERGYPALTLSTFADSDWNARVYDPTGFEPMHQLSPGLVELRDWERAIGLDAIGPRVVKRRPLRA
jgi:GNAT superfamily N-acetyltransferase